MTIWFKEEMRWPDRVPAWIGKINRPSITFISIGTGDVKENDLRWFSKKIFHFFSENCNSQQQVEQESIKKTHNVDCENRPALPVDSELCTFCAQASGLVSESTHKIFGI